MKFNLTNSSSINFVKSFNFASKGKTYSIPFLYLIKRKCLFVFLFGSNILIHSLTPKIWTFSPIGLRRFNSVRIAIAFFTLAREHLNLAAYFFAE